MTETSEERLTRDEASRHFAVSLNRLAWRLLDTRYRDEGETSRMIHAAHASYYHWLEVGTAVNWQRGVWLLSRIYSEIGNGPMATIYATECRSLHDTHLAEMTDFDSVYAIEAEARAHAVSGDLETAVALFEQVRGSAELIDNEEDRKFVLDDIATGNWGEFVLPS